MFRRGGFWELWLGWLGWCFRVGADEWGRGEMGMVAILEKLWRENRAEM